MINNSIENCKNAEIFKLKKKTLVLFTHTIQHHTNKHHPHSLNWSVTENDTQTHRNSKEKSLITNSFSDENIHFIDTFCRSTFRIPFTQQPRVIYNLVLLKNPEKITRRKKLLKNYRQSETERRKKRQPSRVEPSQFESLENTRSKNQSIE